MLSVVTSAFPASLQCVLVVHKDMLPLTLLVWQLEGHLACGNPAVI